MQKNSIIALLLSVYCLPLTGAQNWQIKKFERAFSPVQGHFEKLMQDSSVQQHANMLKPNIDVVAFSQDIAGYALSLHAHLKPKYKNDTKVLSAILELALYVAFRDHGCKTDDGDNPYS